MLEPVSFDGMKRIDGFCSIVVVDFNGVSRFKFLPSITLGIFFLPAFACRTVKAEKIQSDFVYRVKIQKTRVLIH